ncbi:MAG: hypothetical protein QW751_03165 [Candidatus Aenigmatarchaeota archaeon]
MQYPPEVLTKNKKGQLEFRHLLDRGRYVRYDYLIPGTNKRSQNKIRLVLKGKKQEEYFLIPIAGGRFLAIPTAITAKRKLWDGKKAVGLWK